MITWIETHQVISTLVVYYIFSSMTGALPSPDEKSGNFYKFFFTFIHLLGANLMRIPAVRNITGSN